MSLLVGLGEGFPLIGGSVGGANHEAQNFLSPRLANLRTVPLDVAASLDVARCSSNRCWRENEPTTSYPFRREASPSESACLAIRWGRTTQ